MSLLPPTSARNDFISLVGFMESGIDHCRAGRWDKGVEYLCYVASREPRGLEESGLFLSYLGCAVARTQGRVSEGVALCEQAVKVEFYQPENWANLAEVLLLSGRRGEAINAVEQGMDIDSRLVRLERLQQRLGQRRQPILWFLPRSNPVNHLLGLMRSRVTAAPMH